MQSAGVCIDSSTMRGDAASGAFARRGATAFALATLTLALAAPAQASPVSRTCGLLPGDGAYSYIKTRGVTCRSGWRIARQAHRRFCHRHNGCLIQPPTPITTVFAGKIRYRRWRCRVKDGWELSVTRCRRDQQLIVQQSAA